MLRSCRSVNFNSNFTVSSHLQSLSTSASPRSTFFEFTVKNFTSIVLLKYLKQIEIPWVNHRNFCSVIRVAKKVAFTDQKFCHCVQIYFIEVCCYALHSIGVSIHFSISKYMNLIVKPQKRGWKEGDENRVSLKKTSVYHNTYFTDMIRNVRLICQEHRKPHTWHRVQCDLHSSVCFLSSCQGF